MEKVLLFLADGFEEIEGLTVVDILRRVKIDIWTVSVTGKKAVTGSHNILVEADCLLEDVFKDTALMEEVDMLVLPGGMPGTINLGNCEPLINKLKEFNEANKMIAAICAAPSILGTNGILKGKNATCHPGFEDKLLGAEYVKEAVVCDKNVITSRGMGTSMPFAFAILEHYRGKEKVLEVSKGIVY